MCLRVNLENNSVSSSLGLSLTILRVNLEKQPSFVFTVVGSNNAEDFTFNSFVIQQFSLKTNQFSSL